LSLMQSVVTAFLAAGLTAWFALGRFRAEKWWEKKVEAYSAIMEALHHMHRDLTVSYEAEIGMSEVPGELKAELDAKYTAGRNEILRHADLGDFVISEKAAEALVQLEKDFSWSNPNESYFEHLDGKAFAVSQCMAKVKAAGKEDLAEVLSPYRSVVRATLRKLIDNVKRLRSEKS